MSPALVRALGYALLHSVWQGGVLALLLAGVLPLLRRQRAEVRYAASAGALASLVLVVSLTFGFYYQSSPVPVVAGVEVASPALTTVAAPASLAAALTEPVATASAMAPGTPLTLLRANAHRLEAYLPLVVIAWLVGLVLMSGRLAGGLLYASRLRRAGTQALGAEWQQRLATLASRAGVRRPVALLESARVAGPVVLGHLRPVILLPLGAVAGLSPALLEALLAHELAHIVRRDYLLNLGLAVAEVLFFYHPAVWFMATCLRAERENCCDDQAAALCGGDDLRVARALAALAELEAFPTAAPRLALAAAGAAGRGGLLARVRRLALGRPQAPSMSERLLAGSLTLLGLLGLSTGVVLAARPTQTVPGQTAPADTARRRVAVAPPLPPVPPAPPTPDAPSLSKFSRKCAQKW
ncbi:M56 family metallopeptidase [Hymenobacter sp. BRD128]|uniref:M56 family metallopeptidase n=1 Tax=Hymenobacter sp. BRD128 TaxID=2675878 RepID=UPI001563B9C8|nr:M56 family metallopeptidase [Hymenobacter sp. BRD128]QKG56172.1 M56 family metallopeptidase [Hymenobacter sp. BRD128]